MCVCAFNKGQWGRAGAQRRRLPIQGCVVVCMYVLRSGRAGGEVQGMLGPQLLAPCFSCVDQQHPQCTTFGSSHRETTQDRRGKTHSTLRSTCLATSMFVLTHASTHQGGPAKPQRATDSTCASVSAQAEVRAHLCRGPRRVGAGQPCRSCEPSRVPRRRQAAGPPEAALPALSHRQ